MVHGPSTLASCSLTSAFGDPPSHDEIEISLLGRGYGESVVIHLGGGEWAVVDSLLDNAGGSAPLAYLRQVGVDGSAVRLIVATHWHDDHVAGIAELYRASPKTAFAMPLAMSKAEFGAFLSANVSKSIGRFTSGISELNALGQIKRSEKRPAFLLAQTGLPLYRKQITPQKVAPVEVCITALSPGPEDVEQFCLRIAEPAINTDIANRLMPFKQNDISIATWVEFGLSAALLGADLELAPAEDRGWRAVLKLAALAPWSRQFVQGGSPWIGEWPF